MLSPWIPGLLAGTLGVVLVLTHKRRDALLAGIVGVTGGLLAVQILNVHLFTVAVTIWWIASPRRPERTLPAAAPVIVAIPIAMTALVGDLVNNPNLALQLLALSVNAAMLVSRSTAQSARAVLWGLLATCSAAALMALGQVAGVIPNEGWHRDIASLGRPYAFYPEPDWAGLFTAIGLVLGWRLPRPGSAVQATLVVLNAVACVLVLARASWVGVVAALAAYVLAGLFTRNQGRPKRRGGAVRVTICLVVLGIAFLTAVPAVRADFYTRVNTFATPSGSSTDISGRARIQQTEGLLRLVETTPWYGHGISASGRVGVTGRYLPNSENNVGSNWLLALWVDAKYLALPLVLLVLAVAVRRARTIPGQLLVLLLVHNLFSNATFQPITWLVLGLTLGPVLLREDVRAQHENERGGDEHQQQPVTH